MSYSDELVGDVLVTAFEGGINYWCDSGEVSGDKDLPYYWRFVHGGEAKIRDAYEGKYHTLKRKDLVRGMRMTSSQRNTDWDIDFDADDADMAVQFAVFGDVIYG